MSDLQDKWDKASEKIADAAKDVSASAQALKEKFDKKD